MGDGSVKTKEEKYIENDLRDYRIIGRLEGGSSAELFIIQKADAKQSYVIKICAKEGVENGRKKLKGEIDYLKSNELSSLGVFAQVVEDHVDPEIVWYIMPYYEDKKSIHELICEEVDCKDIIFRVFGDLFNNLYCKHWLSAMDDYAIKRNINRVYSRMKKCKQNDSSFEEICWYKTVSINGIEYYNYDFILQSVLNNPVYLKKISPIVATLTHDDLTIENVIVGNGQYVLVDPRGVSDTGYYRDYIYDIAKFTCTLSGFTSIKYGKFEASIENNSITYKLSNKVQKKYDKYYDYIVDCSKYYSEKYFPEDKYWRERLMFSEGCHYLADIACRMYNGDSYGKLIALYARGIEVLNLFFNKIKA